MPRVRIVTLATLYEATGKFEHHLDLPKGATVIDAVRLLARRYPDLARLVFDEEGRLSNDIRVLVNGRPVESVGGLGRPVRDGDTVVLIPPAGGG